MTEARELVIVVPLIPRSAKNSRRIVHVRGRVRSFVSREAQSDEHAIRAAVRDAVGRESWAGSNYVSVAITIDESTGATRIVIRDLGPQPKRGKRDTRRDVHGTIETVMDALTGCAYVDDRQARAVSACYGAVPQVASATKDPTD